MVDIMCVETFFFLSTLQIRVEKATVIFTGALKILKLGAKFLLPVK